ncbi:MAG TPA: hypothetical protein VLS94_12025 [Fusibacter sp.]|nr:hypothetical protein [Fusibacter sp.]
MQALSLKTGEGKFEVYLNAVFLGRDIAVTISGGETPHIGAVAVAIPRKSLKGDGSDSASVSVICIPGHKEDELVQITAKRLSTAWGCHVTVTAGLHIDRATSSDIEILNRNVETLISELMEKMQKNEV